MPTVLLVDDEEGIRKVLGIALADLGYDVIMAENGRHALELFQQNSPPIVITDIKMPVMDGIELLKTIKERQPETEVIVLTGHGDMDLAIQCLKLEATDFVTKPINDDALDIALKRANERIRMRRQLRDYTENLERLVTEKSAQVVELERRAAVGQALDGLAEAMRHIAGDLDAGFGCFNDLPCFVSLHSPRLEIVAANQRFTERIGAHVGRSSRDLYRTANGENVLSPAEKTFATGQGQRAEARVRLSHGEETAVIVHTAPIRNAAGEVELVLEIAADLSEVRRMQEELRRMQGQLSSQGLMIGSVSHAIKGLLTGLDGGMYLLDSGFSKADLNQVKEGWEIVRALIGRIRRLVLDILFYAKEKELKWERVAALDFARNVADLIAPKLERHHIELVCDFSNRLKEMEVDAGIVRATLTNILENALEACIVDPDRAKRHQIRFKVHAERQHIVFVIEDNGIGMDAETRSKIFTPFFVSKKEEGSGLGLFMASQILQRNHGRIDIDSTPGKGTKVTIRIPRRPAVIPVKYISDRT
jgi:PAS domain S-box-containing protein